MGNQISSVPEPEGQLPAAGTIIGFISFTFTLATFLRVTWDNIRVLWSTTHEIHTLLPNLKQALFEERGHLRALRRRCRSQYEEGAFDVLALAVRDMIRQFESLEQPFLRPQFRELDEKDIYSRQRPEDVYENMYQKTYGLGHRWLWLRRRGTANNLSMRLSRIQTRRIARQTKDLALDSRFIIRAVQDIQDRLDEMDRRAGGAVRRRE